MEPTAFHDGRVRLYRGDCREALRELPDCSVDSVVTDPPYALVSIVKRFGKDGSAPAKSNGATGVYRRASSGFMGAKWDVGDTAFDHEFWRDVLRVLKPGAHVLAFGGTRTFHRLTVAIEDGGFEIRDAVMWHYASGFPKSHNQPGGLGTALKPATEIICLARKPLIGTIAANVLAHGTGALNIGACRIKSEGEIIKAGLSDPANRKGVVGTDLGITRSDKEKFQAAQVASLERANTLGRWPANVIHDGSDEVVGAFPETGASIASAGRNGRDIGDVFSLRRKEDGLRGHDDTGGSAARFFYTAKADADDRLGSKHPTVKPLDLMQYLVRLITPKGGTVLDPFAGTGTTGEAALREGMNCILCEREPEYQADIERRMKHVFDGELGRSVAIAKARPQKGEPMSLFPEAAS